MEHSAYHVDLLDESGRVISDKRRIDVNKYLDIYHTIHILLITPRGEVVLSNIPVREDLPNIYAQRMGTTAATIRRTGESANEAAERCMARELFIDRMPLKLLGEKMYELPNERFNFISLYCGIGEAPESYSLLDIGGLVVLTPRDLDGIIERHPEKIADSMITLWRDYRNKLPI